MRRRTTWSEGRTWWVAAGLALFVVIDVVLVAAAMTFARTPRESTPVASTARTASSAASPTQKSATPAAPKTQPTAAATPGAAPAVAPGRVLAAVDGTTAWRATTGTCPSQPGSVQITTDGGTTWNNTSGFGDTGASAVLRLVPTSGTVGNVLVLSGTDCQPSAVGTYVAGADWASYPAQLDGHWYLDPAHRERVQTPNGSHAAPCASAIDLASSSANSAAVLCADHTVFRSGDGGATWSPALQIPGAVAIAAAANGYAVAVTGRSDCQGIGIDSIDGQSGALSQRGCVGNSPPAAGSVALGAGGGTLWIWAGDSSARSTDGGTTWR